MHVEDEVNKLMDLLGTPKKKKGPVQTFCQDCGKPGGGCDPKEYSGIQSHMLDEEGYLEEEYR